MSFYFHRSILDDAGETTELESHEVKTETREMCQHEKTTECNSQYLPEELDREAYLKLFTEFMPFPIAEDADNKAIQNRIDEILDQEELSPEDWAYISVLGSIIYLDENPYPSNTEFDF